MTLRVIAGQFRRRLLKTPSDDSTRPYTDRVRQIVFDRLRDFVPGSRVADVFAGVGTMGIECLSRGAASCVFFEGKSEVHALLQHNVRTIAPGARTICWRVDVRRTSFRPRGGDDCLPYSLIFFDPPYRSADELAPGRPLHASLKRLSRPDVSTPDCILVLRTPEHHEPPDVQGWLVHDCWELSSMMIWILVRPDGPYQTTASVLTRSDQSDDDGESAQHEASAEDGQPGAESAEHDEP